MPLMGGSCEGGTPKLTVQAESTRTLHHWMQPAWVVVGNSFPLIKMAWSWHGGQENRHAIDGGSCEGGTPKLTVRAESMRIVHRWMHPAWVVVENSFAFEESGMAVGWMTGG
ncbi:MAG: hypothetical protein GY710_02215 [Desulfobacteraceae bacterium]|nr:hypothetical protein [Desulfobacteraceae bacterium]